MALYPVVLRIRKYMFFHLNCDVSKRFSKLFCAVSLRVIASTRIKYNSLPVSLLRLWIWDFLTMRWSKIPQFFTFPLSFKTISFRAFGKASIICNQYILWVTLRWNSIFKSFQGFIFPLLLNNWPIKFKIFVREKMYRLTINPKIWVKPNELREDYGWESWFWSKVVYPFYENFLIKR